MIRKAATKAGKSKTSSIVEAIDKKLGLHKSREQLIREMAGWLTHQEAEEFERDCYIPGTIARPASLEGRILYEAIF